MIGSCAPETGDSWLIGVLPSPLSAAQVEWSSHLIAGIFLGGAIFVMINYGLIEIKANPYFANSFLGALILLAIVLDRVREIVGESKRKT